MISGGACLGEDEESDPFRHAFEVGAPVLDGDEVDGCVRVEDHRGISDSVVCPGEHGGPARRLGNLISFETEDGVKRYDGRSLWTDSSGHRLYVLRDNGSKKHVDRPGQTSHFDSSEDVYEGSNVPEDGVLYFHRPSCSECRDAKPHVERLARFVKVVAVNVDKFRDLARRFKVSGVPTLVTIREGAKTGEIHDPRAVADVFERWARGARSNPERAETVRKRVAEWLQRVEDFGVPIEDSSALLDEVDESLSGEENIRILARRFGFPTPAEMGRGVGGVVSGQESRLLLKELERCQAQVGTPLAPDPPEAGESCKTWDGLRGCVTEGRRAWRWVKS